MPMLSVTMVDMDTDSTIEMEDYQIAGWLFDSWLT